MHILCARIREKIVLKHRSFGDGHPENCCIGINCSEQIPNSIAWKLQELAAPQCLEVLASAGAPAGTTSQPSPGKSHFTQQSRRILGLD